MQAALLPAVFCYRLYCERLFFREQEAKPGNSGDEDSYNKREAAIAEYEAANLGSPVLRLF